MVMELEMPEGQKPAVAADLLSDARESWREKAADITVSALQTSVERVLKMMGE